MNTLTKRIATLASSHLGREVSKSLLIQHQMRLFALRARALKMYKDSVKAGDIKQDVVQRSVMKEVNQYTQVLYDSQELMKQYRNEIERGTIKTSLSKKPKKVHYAGYTPPAKQSKDDGFFSSMFSFNSKPEPKKATPKPQTRKFLR